MSRHGIKFGLETMIKLDAELGFPSRSFQSIHIAGTNGKGSVTTKIASCLAFAAQSCSKKIAKYTSPHISTFRERIQINDKKISENEVEELLPLVLKAAEKCNIEPSFFEITTALAFLFYAENNVEIAVLEAGMGGRLDATNIVHPILTIITSIDWDHTQYLGDSLEAIAYEKSGIIKANVPLLLGPKASQYTIFTERANRLNSDIYHLKEIQGNFEKQNQLIAQKGIEILKPIISFEIDERIIDLGLKQLPPCRYETIKLPKIVVMDVAHNPDGLKSLFYRAQQDYPSFDILFGLSRDKDVDECLKIIAQQGDRLFITQAPNQRAASIQELGQKIASLGHQNFVAHADPKECLKLALEDDKPLIICGTFFIMSLIREALGFQDEKDSLYVTDKIFAEKSN